jgi:hypothetical protein
MARTRIIALLFSLCLTLKAWCQAPPKGGKGGQGKLTTGARFVGPRDAKIRRSRSSGRETSGYARLPGHPAEQFHRAVSRGPVAIVAIVAHCWPAHKRRQFGKSSDGDWNKLLTIGVLP